MGGHVFSFAPRSQGLDPLADQSPHFRGVLATRLHRPQGVRVRRVQKHSPSPAESLRRAKRTSGTENTEHVVVSTLVCEGEQCMTHPTNVRRLVPGEGLGSQNHFSPITACNTPVCPTVRATYDCIKNPAAKGRNNGVGDEGMPAKISDVFTRYSSGS